MQYHTPVSRGSPSSSQTPATPQTGPIGSLSKSLAPISAKKSSRARFCSTTKSDGSAERTRQTAPVSESDASSSYDGRHGKQPSVLQTSKTVIYGRLLFLFVLAGAAAGLGYAAYYLTANAEEQLAAERFDSVSERALSTARLVIEEKKRATDSLALMVGSTNPSAEAWPNVYMEGFSKVADSLRIVTEGSLSFCPLVIPGGAEQAAFESFAYNLFSNVQQFPEETGMSAFGKGIWSYGDGAQGNETWPDGRFHIQSGWTYHGSPREILLPFLQSDQGAHRVLMLNVHFEHTRAAAIDSTMTCAAERAANKDYARECGSITDLMWSKTSADVDPGPAGLTMVPVYPQNDNTTLTGFIVGKQIWQDLLKHGFESDVDGLDLVLRTETQAHTYRVVSGEAVYVGPGTDFHDPNAKFQSVGTHINPRFFSNTTVKYYMDIYSSDEFCESYTSNMPRGACIGAVLIMVGTSLLFVCYDYFVRKEFHDKKILIEAKRQFVRFVSHEVRTPLNTVCMGLTLMQHDFADVLGLGRASMHHGSSSRTVSGKPNELLDKKRVEEWMQLSAQVFQNADAAVNVLSDLLNYDKIQMGTLTLELSLFPIWHALERTVHEFQLSALKSRVNLKLDLSLLFLGRTSIAAAEHKEGRTSMLSRISSVGSEQNQGMAHEDRNDLDSKAYENALVSDLPSVVRDSRVIGDSVRLAQVFRNLISNALKFSPEEGTVTIRVSEKAFPKRKRKEENISLKKEETVTVTQRGRVFIEVIDQGVGMTKEQVTSVFDDGTQFNANKFQAGGGSGLGMSIAKGIVHEHGGELSCDSEGLGMGSTFTLSLLLYEPKNITEKDTNHAIDSNSAVDTSLKVSVREPSYRDEEFVIPSLRILVVDDAITNRKLCMRLLERNGHTTEGACDGLEAVDMVKMSLAPAGRPYDCILLDYEMPNMTGPEACKQMRKMGCSSYIAGVTGNVMSEDMDHFRNCGANWVLPKPFRLEALEEQWVEDGVTPYTKQERSSLIQVESGADLTAMGDEVAAIPGTGTFQ